MSTIFSIEQMQLDNTLKPADGGNFVTDNGVVKSEFYNTGNRVVFERNGRRVTWTPSGMKYVDSFGMEDTLFTVQDVPLEAKANYARYNRSMPDVDDWFTQENDRLKHSILLQGFQRDPMPWLSDPIEFVFGGRMEFDPDLRVRINANMIITGEFETGGQIEVIDPDDNLVFTLPQITVYDSGIPKRAFTTGKYRVTSNENGVLAFDIVVDNAWISSVERVYPIIIDPTVIANPSLNPVGSSAKPITELSNGWLVVHGFDSNNSRHIFFKSTDKGNTWTQLCICNYRGAMASIVSEGTTVKFTVIAVVNSADIEVLYAQFDAMTVGATTSIPLSTIYTASGYNQSCFVDLVSVAGVVTIAFSVAVSNTSHAFTMQSSNGGATWSAPIEHYTRSGLFYDIKIDARGSTLIVSWRLDQSVIIYYRYFDGNSWGTLQSKSLTTGASMVNDQTFIIKRNGSNIGRIYLFVTDANANTGVTCHYSDDNGGTWIESGRILTDRTMYTNVSAGENIDGDIWATWSVTGPAGVRYAKIANGTMAWGPETKISSTSYNSYIQRYQVTNILGIVYYDNPQDMFEKIVVNHAPSAPAIFPVDNFDAAAKATVFSWTFSDSDSGDTPTAYQLQLNRVLDNVVVYDTGKVLSAALMHTMPAGTIANGQQYQWKVRVWDYFDAASPYSALGSFWTSAPPTATITSPAADNTTIETGSIAASWSFSDPESEAQSAYQVKLTSSSDAVLWDSGKIADVNARSRTINYNLVNNTSYKIKITTWDAKGIGSAEAVRTFVTSFTTPSAPTVTAVVAEDAFIVISISNPPPSGAQPAVSSNDLFRRKYTEATWTRIATSLTIDGSFSDFSVASGVTYEYMARAYGTNSATVDGATVTAETVTLSGVWLHDVADPASTLHNFKWDGDGRGSEWKPEVSLNQYAGRKRTVAVFGEMEDGKVSAQLDLHQADPDFAKLESLAKSKATVCWRDGSGRVAFGIIPGLPITDTKWGRKTTVEVIETDYSEMV